MSFQCPLCDAGSPDQPAYVRHLADAHGLVDDEGATSFKPEAVEPDAVDLPPVGSPFDRPAPPPPIAPPAFAPLEPSTPTRSALPPPPVGWVPSEPGPHLPPAPPAAQPDVSKRTIALIVAGIVVVAVLAMALVSRSGSPTTSSAGESLGPDSTLQPSVSSTTSVPTGVIASSTSAADSVDPTEARTVAAQLWHGMTAALSRSDTAALRIFEDGPLLESDIGSVCQIGCPPPTFSPIESLTVNVPHQSGWPAMFFAAITYATGCHAPATPCVNQFVAVQSDKGQPWKATELINYGGGTSSMDPQYLPDGFAVAPADAPSVVPPPLADFANYLTALKNTGQKPSSTSLEDGPFTSGVADRMFDPPESQRARGVIVTTTYSVDPADPIYTFSTSGGSTTACGTIRYTAVMTSADGSALPASASIDEWQLPISAGSYRSMTLLGLHMVCFDTRPNQPTFVIASWGGNVSVTGEHA